MADSRGSLSQACSKYPKAFPKELVMALKIGEGGGSRAIAETLRNPVVDDRKFQQEMKEEAVNNSIYPAFLLLATASLIVVIITVLMPKVQELIRVSNAAPPASMVTLLALSAFVQKYGVAAVAALGSGARILGLQEGPKVRDFRDPDNGEKPLPRQDREGVRRCWITGVPRLVQGRRAAGEQTSRPAPMRTKTGR